MGNPASSMCRQERRGPKHAISDSDSDSDSDSEPPTRETIKFSSIWTVRNGTESKKPSASTSCALPDIDQAKKKRRAKLHVRGVGTKSAMARLKREIRVLQTRIGKGGAGLAAVRENMDKALRQKQQELNVLFIES